MTKRGFFIVFEGIDGSGTSTHVHKLEEKIEELDKYKDVLRTHEPWKNEEIRRKLTEDRDAYSDAMEMAELYIQDRVEHTRQIIRPALESGIIVLCSRYKMSTCAYQWSQGVRLNNLLDMHENRGLITPDLTFFLDVPRHVAEDRIKKTRNGFEKFEKDPEFTEKLIRAYNILTQMSDVDPGVFGKVLGINSNRETEQVADEIFSRFQIYYK
ncbi:MAG: dTMP kinase [Nanoarchaeota archaeon]|nr:dTMP kinase [Nanoarchaeota archaeon]